MIFRPDPTKVKEALKEIRERQETHKPTMESFKHELEVYYVFEDMRERVTEVPMDRVEKLGR